jgi:hypothetical protein
MKTTNELIQIFNSSNVGWIFSHCDSNQHDAIAQNIFREMQEVELLYSERFKKTFKPSIFEEIQANIDNMKAFTQTFAVPISVEMRLMAFCLVKGAEILTLTLEYERLKKVTLTIKLLLNLGDTLRSDYETVQTFTSNELWDLEMLKHVGLIKRGGQPLISGYYSFNF